MGSNCVIVMYHYVRDIEGSSFPGIKGLEINQFENQLDYFEKFHNLISPEQFKEGALNKKPLPEKAVLLTFDDGLSDHYYNVFPVLQRRDLKAVFFPSVQPIRDDEVLDAHKIHFILAVVDDWEGLIEEIIERKNILQKNEGQGDRPDCFSNFNSYHRYDDRSASVIKQALQRDLPEPIRKKILDELFQKYVTSDKSSFSRELYMNIEQIRDMKEGGMDIGGHGYSHCWLDSADIKRQTAEVVESGKFLSELTGSAEVAAFCYPYGAYNDSLLEILRRENFLIGFSTEPRIARVFEDDPLLFPRLDTNDFPKCMTKEKNKWTLELDGVD